MNSVIAPIVAPCVFWTVALIALAFWPFLNVNANSLHQLYRDRLGSAFLVTRSAPGAEGLVAADLFSFTKLDPKASPYLIMNAALNVPGSSYANKRARNADFFIFSRNYLGSEATGYVSTERAEKVIDGLNVGTAMAISGAAAAPNMGMSSLRPLSPTIAMLNFRLGRWIRHPCGVAKLAAANPLTRWWKGKPGPFYLLREAFFKSGTKVTNLTTDQPIDSGFVFLTDGGHIENTGIYQLLRRHCKVIIAIDGEADPQFAFASLVQLERFARIDLGTQIQMDWREIGVRSNEVAADLKKGVFHPWPGPHVALGRIDYPRNGTREYGVLVYVKASLSGDENDYVIGYKTAHPAFPHETHETTLEQLFSEEQFEAYRALGEHIMRRFLSGQDQASPKSAERKELIATLKSSISGISPV